MSDSDANTAPEELPQGDLIKILRDQHAEMQDLFATLLSTAEGRQETFDRLRRLIVSHEVAEEMILRPVSAQLVDMKIVAMLDHEELQATEAVKKLEAVDVTSKGFLELAVDLQRTMGEHADKGRAWSFPGFSRAATNRFASGWARAWPGQKQTRRHMLIPVPSHRRMPRSRRHPSQPWSTAPETPWPNTCPSRCNRSQIPMSPMRRG